MLFFRYIGKIPVFVSYYVMPYYYTLISKLILKLNGAKYGKNVKFYGIPLINIALDSQLTIGDNLKVNSGHKYNWCGRSQPSKIYVKDGAALIIGNGVGMSSVVIRCELGIRIGDNTLIGNDVSIYDSDFHSLSWSDRRTKDLDRKNVSKSQIIIGSDVFIGAHSTILKGVKIGDRAIVGACSLVIKDIPDDEIWGGSPARFIRKL